MEGTLVQAHGLCLVKDPTEGELSGCGAAAPIKLWDISKGPTSEKVSWYLHGIPCSSKEQRGGVKKESLSSYDNSQSQSNKNDDEKDEKMMLKK